MPRPAIGFYWTRPVPYVGFTSLPDDAERAAKKSKTIRYQRALIHRYAKDNGYSLIEERVFMEIEPDRVTEQMGAELDALRPRLEKERATLLALEFGQGHGERKNWRLKNMAESAGANVVLVPADPIMLDGKVFDPHAHFSNWKSRQKKWTTDKAARIAAALARAWELKEEGHSLPIVADRLNREGLRTANGKDWTADNLSKALKAVL